MLLNKEILIGIYGAGKKPTYTIIPNKLAVNEGDNITFDIITTKVLNGTILYWDTLTNNGIINGSDFDDNLLSGSIVINNNIGSIIRNLSADFTSEGVESFQIQIRTDSILGPIVATSPIITINDTSTTPPPIPGPYSFILEIDTTLV